ncbi:ExbD/TolR family protein [Marinobacter sp.]|uniref:ExbD/TolR family protein n=1 Tax=Marinobacter sp. TaxID=50741 RepID=UPI00384E558D
MPIRMTPLIDVVFILLVFFMLTTRLLPTGHLNLENTTAPASSVTGETKPELLLAETGNLRWQGRDWPLAELLPALASSGISEVNLKASGSASLADFTQALGVLDQAGIEARWRRTPPETGTP